MVTGSFISKGAWEIHVSLIWHKVCSIKKKKAPHIQTEHDSTVNMAAQRLWELVVFNDGFSLDKVDSAAGLKSICSTHSHIFSYDAMVFMQYMKVGANE